MTNTENSVTVTIFQLAEALDTSTDHIEVACFMLGIPKLWPFNAVQAERITDWICGNGGQDVDGGVTSW